MEQKNDIGKMIEERLQDTVEAPAGLKWDRVSASLDKRDRKRRFLLLIWTGVAVSGMAIMALLFYNGYTNTEKEILVTNDTLIPTNQAEGTDTVNTIDLNENEKQTGLIRNDSAIQVFASESSLQNAPLEEANSEMVQVKKKEPKTTQPKEIPPTNEDWVTNKTQEDITKTFTLDSVTTYRYYNHNTENELITTNKKTIDSLVELSERTKDSIN